MCNSQTVPVCPETAEALHNLWKMHNVGRPKMARNGEIRSDSGHRPQSVEVQSKAELNEREAGAGDFLLAQFELGPERTQEGEVGVE